MMNMFIYIYKYIHIHRTGSWIFYKYSYSYTDQDKLYWGEFIPEKYIKTLSCFLTLRGLKTSKDPAEISQYALKLSKLVKTKDIRRYPC
jgi:hypothetical protein